MKRPWKTEFERCALASGLLSLEQIEEARTAICPPDAASVAKQNDPSQEQLADQLVELGCLNIWQATQLLEGRTKFTLGNYRIIDSLGRGGMGHVFKAEHQVLGRVVAVKVLPREKSTPEAIVNFGLEIHALSSLDHENLVRALDDGEDGNVHYLVTEFVAGADLRKLVRERGPLSMEAAASIISQAAAGLQYAHEQGIIHRDVKPGNLLVTPDGHAKLSDLGLAGPLGGDAENDPRFGKIVGTADYMSPDHIISPREPTPAWDIYSLGCTLYYALTGKVPFPKGTLAEKAKAHCEDRPLDPRRLNPNLDAAMVEVMADMLSKNPAERISSAEEVIRRLAPWVNTSRTVPMDVRPNVSQSAAPIPPPVQKNSLKTSSDSKATPNAQLRDTAPSFPDISTLAPDNATPTSDTESATPFHSSPLEGIPTITTLPPTASHPPSLLRPLAYLVFLPLLLVGLVALFWWLIHLAR